MRPDFVPTKTGHCKIQLRPPGVKTGQYLNLEEGPVTLTFPASLSANSYQDLSDYLSLFLRKAKRHADAIRQFDEMVGKTGDE